MVNFNNTEIAFEYKSDFDLYRAYCLFKTIQSGTIVNLSSKASSFMLQHNIPLAWIMKPTLYKQFVGGEDLDDCKPIIDKLHEFYILSTLDYSAEGGDGDTDTQHTYNEIIHSIKNAAGNPAIAYAVFKPSGLVTEAQMEGILKDVTEYGEEEKHSYHIFQTRFMSLCETAARLNVRLLVDAEEYKMQDLIDDLTEQAMEMYNTERAYIFATLQMYRHDRMAYLQKLYKDAVAKGYQIGMKFVRGAYMEKERTRAKQIGYPSPICATKQETDDNFNAGVRFVVEHIDKFELFCGTHNEESCKLLAEAIEANGLRPNDHRIFFAQLLGMSDNITFNLADAGYNTTKYVPYAPVEKVLPYLLRRMQENSSVAGQTGRELRMLKLEIARRKHAGKKVLENKPV